MTDLELTYFFDPAPLSGTSVTPTQAGAASGARVPETGPGVESVTVDPPLVEHGGGVDVTVQFRNATVLRIQAPDGVQTDFPVDPAANSATFHLRPCFGGVISVIAVNAAAATESNPLGCSTVGTASVRTYTLPPLDVASSLYHGLGAPVVQVDAATVPLAEPTAAELSELARLREGLVGAPNLLPAVPPTLGFPFSRYALAFVPGTSYPAPEAETRQPP